MPELLTFVLGDLFGILTLTIGILLGFWLGRMWYSLIGGIKRERRKDLAVGEDQQSQAYHEQLAGMIEFTNNFSGDLSEQMEMLEKFGQTINVSGESGRVEDNGPSAKAVELLAQITAANQRLKQRLESAEATLKTQARDLEESLSEARTDALTGILNRRAFNEEQGRRWAYWQRKQAPYSLAILDIDHFKQVNDRYGHDAGDNVLKVVAARLRGVMRETDHLARIGGEEMGIMIPEADADSIVAVARKILDAVRAKPVLCDHREIPITVSCGLMSADRADSIDQLMKGADEALYAAKESGRNCGYYNDGTSLIPIEELATGEPCSQPTVLRGASPRPETEDSEEPPIPTNALESVARELKSRLFQVSQRT